MSSFAAQSDIDRGLTLESAQQRLGISPLILEKDFWVCWILARVFEDAEIAPHVLFKGGTSLSKVYGVIARFSEDVDLGVSPARLGFNERELNEAPSKSRRPRDMDELGARCAHHVEHEVVPRLERGIVKRIGPARTAPSWLKYEFDAATSSPVVLFSYPSVVPAASDYIRKLVKLEFGSLTNQRPLSSNTARALLCEIPELEFDDLVATVVALDIERTFWEKATILHKEFHRPSERPLPARSARHFTDFAALWNHESRGKAMTCWELLADVALHKSRFFASGWASYETAKRGSMRMTPSAQRADELRRDFEKMRPMYLGDAPDFDGVLAAIADAERTINAA